MKTYKAWNMEVGDSAPREIPTRNCHTAAEMYAYFVEEDGGEWDDSDRVCVLDDNGKVRVFMVTIDRDPTYTADEVKP